MLEDNLHVLPRYQAVYLARLKFTEEQPQAWAALRRLEGSLSVNEMIHLNAQVDIDKIPVAQVIDAKLGATISKKTSAAQEIWQRTREHLVLVAIALLFSIAVGIPLGVLADNNLYLGKGILLVSGLVQTIPSLALLCFLIPLFGIGLKPALGRSLFIRTAADRGEYLRRVALDRSTIARHVTCLGTHLVGKSVAFAFAPGQPLHFGGNQNFDRHWNWYGHARCPHRSRGLWRTDLNGPHHWR